jgi:RNA polymerase sigma-70 factor (ECF subfamily)
VNNPDWPSLVGRAQQGDRKAFEAMVGASARMVYAQIVASVRDRQKAEDLTQETFIAAWKGLPGLKETGGFVPWLLTVARNTTRDAIRFEHRQKRQSPSATGEAAGAAEEVADDADPPSEQAACSESRQRALRLLEELPEDYRRPLMLRYLGGADYETIKRQLSLTDGALRGLLNRGMALLRERMIRIEK